MKLRNKYASLAGYTVKELLPEVVPILEVLLKDKAAIKGTTEHRWVIKGRPEPPVFPPEFDELGDIDMAAPGLLW